MTSDQVLAITEKLSSIGTKVDTMVDGFKELKENLASNYVTKEAHEATKKRLDKLESLPTKYLSTLIALAGVGLALLSYLRK